MMLDELMKTNADLTEARLARWLEKAAGAHAAPDRLAAAMRYGALGGGKRLRPHLLIESAKLFAIPAEAALDAAAALECVHCYSLIHDDLPAMDDDDLRRGRPTVHRAFDEATAILAGDALLTLAFEILAGPGAHPDPSVRIQLIERLARAAGWGGMAGGQMLDLDAPEHPQDAASITRLQAMKTGALIVFACEAGGLLGGAGAAEQAALLRFGEVLGRAFQLADDLLDVEGDAAKLGKATGKDDARGKATLVALWGVEEARRHLAALEREAVAALEPFGARGESLAETARFVVRRER